MQTESSPEYMNSVLYDLLSELDSEGVTRHIIFIFSGIYSTSVGHSFITLSSLECALRIVILNNRSCEGQID